MRSEKEIRERMKEIESRMDEFEAIGRLALLGQYATLQWVLGED